MKLNVIGMGYIGLPTAAVFAKSGVDVVGVDINKNIVEGLNQGEIHIEEPGLSEVISEMVQSKKFKASLFPEKADAFIIAVPTPNNDDVNKSCDLRYVLEATKQIVPYLEVGNLVIVESTIEPRTMEDYIKPLIEKAGYVVGKDIYVVHCPERVLPGQILKELVENNRIVGGVTPQCAIKAADLYKIFVKGEIVLTDSKTAEMSKLMENTFRDVNIALANELTKVCNDLSINVLDVINMANKHPRVNIHTPGPGVGGHCLAVDPYFIIAKSPENTDIIRSAREVNNSMPKYVVETVEKMIININEPKITIFGVTYKGNVDDTRESPAFEIIQRLKNLGIEVLIHDPHVDVEKLKNNILEVERSIEGSDLILVLTNHNEFKNLDLDKLFGYMRTPQIFDTVNIISSSVSEFGNLYNYGNTFSINDSKKEKVRSFEY
ncbi:UDP-N-acetyl-D-mannosamine dehydrogenase [Exiguobacterium sp. N4-1P]|uniref:nucleotide sugar dehydrogenase n=1 Tax=unclassified Exiguobacterium TaxID=2644629 RepID=UPI000B593448|nr:MULTISPECIES: nucleotide sugar dehydrogenase [unclassified Exiguobacterium]ASI36428.1 UDP-N-acetyl-D-mannosamine dehydrogenase [Exiguobacterium sp. N4-1P]